MSKTLASDLRNALRDRFRAVFEERLHQLILYGSYARGEATSHSDIDVMVVLDGEVGREEEEQAYSIKRAIFEEHGKDVSPIVTARDRFETYNQPLYRNVRSEGELLVPEESSDDAVLQHTYPLNRSPRGMKEATEDALDRARESLDAAQLLLEAGKGNSSISSAYYAMLYAARAALNEAGEAPKSHKGVQHQLREVYVVDGPLPARYHSLLCKAEEKRLEADYEMRPSFTATDAEQWSARAEDFVDTIETMLLENTD